MLPTTQHAKYPLAALLLLAGLAPAALGQTPNRYALLHIRNKTTDMNISYNVRWGADSEWAKTVTLKPGEVWNHWYTYPTPNQNSSPTPQVKFESGIGKARGVKTYDLKAFAVPTNTDNNGKYYEFEKDKAANGEWFLELYAGKAAPAPEVVAKSSPPTSAERQAAIAALNAYRMGSTLSPAKLKDLNELPSGEPLDKPDAAMGGNGSAKKFIAAEVAHFLALEKEMTAAADVFLSAAVMTDEQRAARGYKLIWLFGPVTAPNMRSESKDGLGGLRVIGRLDLPDGKQINCIMALKFHPNLNPFADDEGKVAPLGNADNFRLEIRYFKTGEVKNDFAFQSFSVTGEGAKMTMKPGFYIDPKTGMSTHKDLVFTALGTSCINCHLAGPKIKAPELALMEKKDYANMEGMKSFVEQMKHWGSSKNTRRKMEEIMSTKGPRALLPLLAMQMANREHWISLYTRGSTTLASATAPAPDPMMMPELPGSKWKGSETLAGFGKLNFQFNTDGSAVMIDAKGTTNGKWAREGNRVTLTFNNCIYVGTWDGQRLRGNAQFTENQRLTGTPWTFEVTPG